MIHRASAGGGLARPECATLSVFFLTTKNTFIPSESYWRNKVNNYLFQDQRAKRDTSNNVTVNDFNWFMELCLNEHCHLCGASFSNTNKPTLDRINNELSHTKTNVKLACVTCNKLKSNRDEEITRLKIRVKQFADQFCLPKTITNEDEYKVLREGITGGLSNVMHRVNLKDITHINKIKYENNKVISYDTPYVIKRVVGIDFNSLYPSSFSSEPHPFNPYTDNKMYMPGSLKQIIRNKDLAMKIINERKDLFIAVVKGYIPNINEFINYPPIFRNIDIEIKREVIGDYMMNVIEKHNLCSQRHQRKLTQLLSTHNEYMSFSSYYLWFLIDTCGFIVEDIKVLFLYDKHGGFNRFVKEMMNKRIEEMSKGNKSAALFCKLCMNGSYGYDGMNTEKYNKVRVTNEDKVRSCFMSDTFVDSVRLNEDTYLTESKTKSTTVKTCLQEAYFTLDNAKYWFLNFLYNFLFKCLDPMKYHYVEGDTDSIYLAIAADSLDDIVLDEMKSYWNENKNLFFPDPKKGVSDEKKLLGVAIENEADNAIALAPKCYTLFNNIDDCRHMRFKGVRKDQNKHLNTNSFIDVVTNNTVIKACNRNLQLKNNIMSSVLIEKNALTSVHTKMIVLSNGCCCPYIAGLSADAYSTDPDGSLV